MFKYNFMICLQPLGTFTIGKSRWRLWVLGSFKEKNNYNLLFMPFINLLKYKHHLQSL